MCFNLEMFLPVTLQNFSCYFQISPIILCKDAFPIRFLICLTQALRIAFYREWFTWSFLCICRSTTSAPRSLSLDLHLILTTLHKVKSIMFSNYCCYFFCRHMLYIFLLFLALDKISLWEHLVDINPAARQRFGVINLTTRCSFFPSRI